MSDGKFAKMNGIPVWSAGESIYGLLVFYEAPGKYFKVPTVGIAEIVKAQNEDGWKFKLRKLTDEQKAKGFVSKRVYINQDFIPGVQEAINRLMSENTGECGPDVEDKFQYEKVRSNKAVDKAIDEFSEFGSAPASDADDTEAPF